MARRVEKRRLFFCIDMYCNHTYNGSLQLGSGVSNKSLGEWAYALYLLKREVENGCCHVSKK